MEQTRVDTGRNEPAFRHLFSTSRFFVHDGKADLWQERLLPDAGVYMEDVVACEAWYPAGVQGGVAQELRGTPL